MLGRIAPDIEFQKLKIILRFTGMRGLLKSVYMAAIKSEPIGSVVFSGDTALEVHKKSELHINSRLLFGLNPTSYANNKRGKSVFHLSKGASFATNGTGTSIIKNGVYLYIDGKFSMGDSYIGNRARIHCYDEIIIGDNCSISWEVEFIDYDFHRINTGNGYSSPSEKIVIGDNVWIGCQSIILKGVTIGDGAVVGAGSVVTKDVPEQSLVAGNPAQVVCENVEWD